jgi:hypothetical protein
MPVAYAADIGMQRNGGASLHQGLCAPSRCTAEPTGLAIKLGLSLQRYPNLLRAGILMVTLLESLGSYRGATKFGYNKLSRRPTGDRSGSVVQEHLFLGIDKRDAEAQRDLWPRTKSGDQGH